MIVALLITGVTAVSAVRFVEVHRDADGDGISDCQERAGLQDADGVTRWRTDPSKADTDEDGAGDRQELHAIAVGRFSADHVRELWSCSRPVYVALADPSVADADNDGLSDAVELSDGTDPEVADADEDGADDGLEKALGSDPGNADTDDDGTPDGEDEGDDRSPLISDAPWDATSWAKEFGEGALFGDFRDPDTVPQLLGSLVTSLIRSTSIFGIAANAFTGGRDAISDLIDGDAVGAGLNALSAIPFGGSSASQIKKVLKFVADHPTLIPTVMRAIAAWKLMPNAVRMTLLATADASVKTLASVGLTDPTITRIARTGSRLAGVTSIVLKGRDRLIAARIADATDGVVPSADAAGSALRAYAKELNDGAVSGPVYIDVLPFGRFVGGRLIDACSHCSEGVVPGRSVLRIAKVGPQVFSASEASQVAKDARLVDHGYHVEWHFFEGPTGIDLDPKLVEALDEAGVETYVHLPDSD
ncbi:hypothetical protein [Nocardioides fonticola]|uniref:hypothetical protein n=1 Tax=Nocardioides fonticola TaxID=450363 RepID=UPI0031CEDD86